MSVSLSVFLSLFLPLCVGACVCFNFGDGLIPWVMSLCLLALRHCASLARLWKGALFQSAKERLRTPTSAQRSNFGPRDNSQLVWWRAHYLSRHSLPFCLLFVLSRIVTRAPPPRCAQRRRGAHSLCFGENKRAKETIMMRKFTRRLQWI